MNEKNIGRRRFLKWAAALGLTGMSGRLLGGKVWAGEGRDVSIAFDEPSDDLDYHIYLPFVSKEQLSDAHGPSKVGIHTVRPDGAIEFVRGVHDEGAHVAIVKAVDDFGYLRDVKTVSPETVTVARWSGGQGLDYGKDPAEDAARIMDLHMPRWEYEKDVVDYWEIINEVDPPSVEGHIWLTEFNRETMNIADENGYKLAIFSYSVGVPEWHEWEAIVDTGIFAQAKETGHILALHEYNYPVMDYRWGEPMADLPTYEDRGVLTGRYRYLYRDFLIPRDEVVPLAITETGLDPTLMPGQPHVWRKNLVDGMIWYDTVMREDDYVIGATMFTLGGIGVWEDYDYEELLPEFHDYIVSLKDA